MARMAEILRSGRRTPNGTSNGLKCTIYAPNGTSNGRKCTSGRID